MRPISDASTATCSGLEPLPQSTSRHKHDDISSAQLTEQIHDAAMLDVVMAEADEEPVLYNRRGRRICLPARFQATPCEVKMHAFLCLMLGKLDLNGVQQLSLTSLAQCDELFIADFAAMPSFKTNVNSAWCANVPQLWRR